VSLKYGILGLLAEQPLHGYDVKTRYEALFAGTWDLNIGQVYTTLQRLERDGLVTEVGERGDRGKQRYGLTAAGQTALQEWMHAPEEEPQQLRQDIYLKLLLISRMANGNLDGLLARQRRVYLQRLKDLGDLERQVRAQGRDDLVLLIQGAMLHTEADLKWIDVCAEEARHTVQDAGGTGP
jgi:DNA-binding PadR family transcriptional regulator